MVRIAARAIIVDNNKLLLAKLKSEEGTVNEFYCVIGGGLNDSENLIDCLKREVTEETGVKRVEVGKLIAIQQYRDSQENLEFFFQILNSDDFKKIDLTFSSHCSDEIAEIGFFDPRDVTVMPKFISESDANSLVSASHVRIVNNL